MADVNVDTSDGIQLPGSIEQTQEHDLPVVSQGMGSDLDQLVGSVNTGDKKGLYAQIAKAEKSKAYAAAATEKQAGDLTGKYRSQLADAYEKNKPSDLDTTTGKPTKPQENPVQNFGSLASMIGIFASAFTKKPIVNALNASATAMNAKKKGDMDAYDQAYKEYKDNIKDGLEKHKLETENLNEIMDVMKTDYAAGMAQLRAYGAAHSSDAAAFLATLGDTEEYGKYVASMNEAQTKGQEAAIKMSEHLEKQREEMQEQKIYDDTLKEQKASGKSDAEAEALALAASHGKLSVIDRDKGKKALENIIADPNSDKTKIEFAKKALSDIQNAETKDIFGSPAKMALRTWINEQRADGHEPTADEIMDKMVEINSKNAMATSSARRIGTQGTTIELSSNLLNNSLPILEDSFKKVDNSKFSDWNSFTNFLDKHKNDPDLEALNENILNTESDLALLIRRGGASTVDSQNRAHAIINNALNLKSFEAFKEQVFKESKAAVAAEKKTKESIIGNKSPTDDNSNRPLTPEELEEFNKLKGQ